MRARLPMRFAWSVQGWDLLEFAWLRDSRGSDGWIVYFEISDSGEMYLFDGWKSFICDHEVGRGSVLRFRYDIEKDF